MADVAPDLLVTDEGQLRELTVGSGIPLDLIAAAGLFTVRDVKELARLVAWSPKAWDAEIHLPALAFPYRFPGSPDAELFSVKPRSPKKWTDDNGEHEAKYVRTRGVKPAPPYLPPNLYSSERRLLDASLPKIITEGEKKALAACAIGLSCIAVPGVDNWRRGAGTKHLHPLLKRVAAEGPDLFLCYDSDRSTNITGVRRAEREFSQALASAGAAVYVIRLPNGPGGAKWGLDDFIVAKAASAAFELRQLMAEAKKAGPLATPDGPTQAPAFATATTDLGNAERLVKRHGEDLRYCEGLGGWFIWDSSRWMKDETEEVSRRANSVVKKIFLEAAETEDRDLQHELVDHAHRSQHRARLEALVARARSLEGIPLTPGAFDAHAFELNTPNGIVDLHTGQLRPHDRARFHTKTTAVEYEPNARRDEWELFLDTVTGCDAEMLSFLQAAVGYSLTADTREEKFFFVHGQARTGKSTFLRAITRVLGSYSKTTNFDTFIADKVTGNRPRPDLVALVGSRFVVSIEVQDGQSFAEGLVKSITGNDVLAVRNLYGQMFEYTPGYKLWLAANDAPRIRKEDDAMWRRILRVPFDRTIENPDAKLKQTLVADAAAGRAILAWAVRGCLQWQESGLIAPRRVVESTEEYRREMDPTADFFSTLSVVEEDVTTTKKSLREAYEAYCKELGASALGARRFAGAVREHIRAFGFEGDFETTAREEGAVRQAWRHLRLRRASDPDPEGQSRYEPDRKTIAETGQRSGFVAGSIGQEQSSHSRARVGESLETAATAATAATKPLQTGSGNDEGELL